MNEPIIMQPGVVADLPLSVVDFDPDQPRSDFDETYIADLAADIKATQVNQPITVRAGDKPGKYFIKYGECRYRASKLAKKPTIPALLDTEETRGDPLSRMLDQVKENHNRAPLNPMEMAAVIIRMRNDHKIKSNAKIEETFKAHGINNLGRAYISNLARLVELPEWAQRLIRAGKLTAAHGKYLLPACASAEVIEAMRVLLVDRGEDVSVRGLQHHIYNAFAHRHQQLESWTVKFDYREECVKAGCQKMRKIGRENHDSTTFCLDRACFDEKNAAAEKRQQTAAQGDPVEFVPPAVTESNEVDTDRQEDVDWHDLRRVPFDIRGCQSCEHCHVAVFKTHTGEEARTDACFEPPENGCLDAKRDAHFKELVRAEKMNDIIRHWLLIELGVRIKCDTNSQLAIITLAALSDLYDQTNFGHQLRTAQVSARESAGIEDIRNILDSMTPNAVLPSSEQIASSLLQAAKPALLIQLADYFGLDISDYRIDEEYLEYLDDDGLTELFLANAQCWPESTADDIRSTCATLDGTELIDMLMQHAEQIQTPPEIEAAWNRAIQTNQPKQAEQQTQQDAEPAAESAA